MINDNNSFKDLNKTQLNQNENFKEFFDIIEIRIENLDKDIKNQNDLKLKIESLLKEKQDDELTKLNLNQKIKEFETIINEKNEIISYNEEESKNFKKLKI